MLICIPSAGRLVLRDSSAERQRKRMQVPISQPPCAVKISAQVRWCCCCTGACSTMRLWSRSSRSMVRRPCRNTHTALQPLPSAISGLHALPDALYGCVLPQDCLSQADEQCTPPADKNSGVVLRAPFLATVLKQVRCPWCPLLGMPGPNCPCHMLLPGQTLFLWQEGIQRRKASPYAAWIGMDYLQALLQEWCTLNVMPAPAAILLHRAHH